MTRPRMLVTGGSGYLGHWVIELARTQWDIAATFGRRTGSNDGVAWHQLDIRDGEAVHRLFAEIRPDVVVHTAALNPGQGTDFEGVNVTGTANVAAAAGKHGARLVHVSTDIVFDGRRGDYTEADTPNPLNEYGRTKLLAETAVAESGVDAAVVRTSLIYGWRPTVARAAQWMIDAINRGDPVTLWSDEMRNPIWVESLAAALDELAGLRHTGLLHTGLLHVAGAQPMSRYDFGIALLRFHGVDTSSVEAIPSPSDAVRPLNCTMDSSQARSLLATPLPGVNEVLARHDPDA